MLHPPSVGAAPTAPCTSISRFLSRRSADDAAAAPPASPAPPTSLERVLRLSARALPCAGVNPVIAQLDRIAAELRGVRVYYLHDVETCSAIDAWLELFAGSR